MSDPYEVLGVPRAEATDELVRRRYLELTRQYPPEQFPAESARVRSAYDALKDVDARVAERLTGWGHDASVDQVLEMLACQTPRPRPGLAQLTAPTPAPPTKPAPRG